MHYSVAYFYFPPRMFFMVILLFYSYASRYFGLNKFSLFLVFIPLGFFIHQLCFFPTFILVWASQTLIVFFYKRIFAFPWIIEVAFFGTDSTILIMKSISISYTKLGLKQKTKNVAWYSGWWVYSSPYP